MTKMYILQSAVSTFMNMYHYVAAVAQYYYSLLYPYTNMIQLKFEAKKRTVAEWVVRLTNAISSLPG